MQHSETLGKLGLALAKVQGAILPAIKDSNNPFFRSKYADLASVWDACRAELAANELAVIQGFGELTISDSIAKIEATTMLVHSSGEWIKATLQIPVSRPESKDSRIRDWTAQTAGSAYTYARRYGLAAIVGVYQDDDDGNSASKHVPQRQESRPMQSRPIVAPKSETVDNSPIPTLNESNNDSYEPIADPIGDYLEPISKEATEYLRFLGRISAEDSWRDMPKETETLILANPDRFVTQAKKHALTQESK